MKSKHDSEGKSKSKNRPLDFVSAEEANAYSQKKGDSYYCLAYGFIEAMRRCMNDIAQIYTNTPSPKRRVQTGLMRQMIRKWNISPQGDKYILNAAIRLSDEELTEAKQLDDALRAFFMEVKHKKWWPRTSPFDEETLSVMLDSVCDWVESYFHLCIHCEWYHCPDRFSPDRDIYALWNLGMAVKQMGKSSAQDKAALLQDIDAASTKYADHPGLWAHLGSAMQRNLRPRTWTHPKVDMFIIGVWPLVMHYNWTYEDLLNVCLHLHLPNNIYPCDSVDSLKVHCRTILGLTKLRKGKSVGPAKLPEGWQIAEQL